MPRSYIYCLLLHNNDWRKQILDSLDSVIFSCCSQVGAAHCYSQGDDPSRYSVTCGEHSLQKRDKYEVNLQVITIQLEKKLLEE